MELSRSPDLPLVSHAMQHHQLSSILFGDTMVPNIE